MLYADGRFISCSADRDFHHILLLNIYLAAKFCNKISVWLYMSAVCHYLHVYLHTYVCLPLYLYLPVCLFIYIYFFIHLTLRYGKGNLPPIIQSAASPRLSKCVLLPSPLTLFFFLNLGRVVSSITCN